MGRVIRTRKSIQVVCDYPGCKNHGPTVLLPHTRNHCDYDTQKRAAGQAARAGAYAAGFTKVTEVNRGLSDVVEVWACPTDKKWLLEEASEEALIYKTFLEELQDEAIEDEEMTDEEIAEDDSKGSGG